MFSGKMDQANTYLDIQSGSGGRKLRIGQKCFTDVFEMGRKQSFKTELIEVSQEKLQELKAPRLNLKAILLMVGLEQNQVFIDWLESLLSILEIVAIPLLHQFLYRQK